MNGHDYGVAVRFLRSLLRVLLPAATADVIIGDLDEGFARAARRHGRRSARRTYRRDALRSLWDVASRRRRLRLGSWFNGLGNELRVGLRAVTRDVVFCVTAIATLALGIGLVTVAFAVVRGSVLRGLPFVDAHELIHFERSNRAEGQDSLAVTPHDYEAWSRQQASFEGLGAYVEALFVFAGVDALPERHWGLAVSANTFDLLGVEPLIGRGFSRLDDAPGADDVVLIGYRLWQSRFAGERSVVGREFVVNGRPMRIVGVMPAGFGFPVAEQLWRPLKLDVSAYQRGGGRLDVFGRLRDGVGLEQARAEMAAITARLAEQFADTNDGISAELRTFTEEYVGAEFTGRVWLMLAAAVLMLLLAVSNVSTLWLARAGRRTGEMAVRAAIGAGWAKIVRVLLVEVFWIGLGGLVGALLIAHWGLALFERTWAGTSAFALPHGPDAPFWWNYRLDATAFGVTVAAAVAAATIAGLLPAVQLARADIAELVKSGGRRSRRRPGTGLVSRLVVVEIALCTALLVCAGLVARSVANLGAIGQGIDAEGVYTATAYLPGAAVFSGAPRSPAVPGHATTEDRLALWAEFERVLAALPNIAESALASSIPVASAMATTVRTVDDVEVAEARARFARVTPGYFDVLGVKLREGRAFQPDDDSTSLPVAIVNESFAARHFPGQGVVGRRIRLGDEESPEPWLTIVGLVPDLWLDGSRDRDRVGLYLPAGQAAVGDVAMRAGRTGARAIEILVRPRGDGPTAMLAVRHALAALDPGAPASGVRTLRRHIDDRTERYRLHGAFYLVLGWVSVLLATIGIYGVAAGSVGLRRSEFGTRMALGADARGIGALVLRGAVRQAIAGSLLGALLSAWLQPQLGQILYGVAPWDPWVLLAVVGALGVVAVGASLLPAVQAARVSPVIAMRGG